MAKRIMISQPMGGLTDEEIYKVRNKAIFHVVNDLGYIFENTFFKRFAEENDKKNKSLFYLAKSLEVMSNCDAVYFCKGWENKRGCRIEHETAKEYGLEIIYED